MVITGITKDGLVLDDGDASWAEPWDAVSGIQAARVPDAGHSILLLVIGIRDERIILVEEREPIWDALVRAIYSTLPGTLPTSAWKAELGKPGKIAIYDSAWPAAGNVG